MTNQIESVSLERLVGHPDNPNHMSRVVFRKLAANIKRTGRYEPLIVRPHRVKSGSFEIINGHHRAKALAELGFDKADVIVWDVDDEEAGILLMTLNRLCGSDLVDKKMSLLRELNSKKTAEQLSKILPQTASGIRKLLAFKLPSVLAEANAKSFAATLVFFVDGCQQAIIEEAMAKAPISGDISSDAWCKAAKLEKIAKFFLRAFNNENEG